PQALRALAELRAKAALPPLEAALGSGAPWPAPRETAAAIVAELERRAQEHEAVVTSGNRRAANAIESRSGKSVRSDAKEHNIEKRQRDEISGKPEEEKGFTNEKQLYIKAPAVIGSKLLRSDRFDPRAVILVYLFLAACVLAQKTALELSLAALVILVLLAPFQVLIWPWIRVIRAYAIMIIIFCIIGGIGIVPLSFDWDKVWPIALRFGKLLLVMVLSMPILKLMTPYRLQRAIEQTFGFLERIKLPIHSFALIVTLIFRFIPLLTGEWERFAKLAHARGKAVTPLKTVPFKNLVPILIPYVRSVLRLAEQMADALEARGFGYKKRKPTYAFRLRFNQADAGLLSIGFVSGALLLLLAYLL
ncbi:energy-coupling factor transporter transmembrane component T, partial [Paenibacillus sp. LHD-38]|uniref:energy-coupling factor transporter transmembrane component T n=1 Tax=Paenibacillus sp. LHD-38 TaxID=3072143 RepID=UPI00280D5F0A